ALRSGGIFYQVEVTARGGPTASVEWKHPNVKLHMPSLPPDAMLTRGEADRMAGYVIHECCHVLHSNMDVWHDAIPDGARVQAWTNALEDVRIEAKEIGLGHFPAMRGLLSTLTNHLHYEAATTHKGPAIGSRVTDAPYVACILGRKANGYDLPAAAGLT